MDVPNIADNVISTPLCSAARRGEYDDVRQLLHRGHHVNLNDNRGWTPLHEAVAHGHLDCVRLLLQTDGCNENACTYEGMSPMYVACQYQNNVDLIKLLVDHGVSCNKGNTEKVTPLHVAAKFNKFGVMKELVKHGASVNALDFNEYTPLMESIEQFSNIRTVECETHLEVIRFLLDSGTSLSVTDLYGRTHLHVAVCEGFYECVQLLLEYGSDVNTRTLKGSAAIFDAARIGNLSLVNLLLDHGARADIICSEGTMPLHFAIHGGHISVAEELLKRQNMNDIIRLQKEVTLQSFLIFAIDSGSFETFKLVMNHKIYSSMDKVPFKAIDDDSLVDEICLKHYKYHSPLSFLLAYHLENQHVLPMMKTLHDTGGFSVNAVNEDFLPPLVALIATSINAVNKSYVSETKKELFLKLLEMAADIDYYSVKNISGSLNIPDAALSVIIPKRCDVAQSLLLPVLAHCFACDWDDLFDWLVRNRVCNAAVLLVLIKLGNKSKQSLIEAWETLEYCKCVTCMIERPNIQKVIYEKDMTLQSLCRARLRQWLWEKTRNSAKAEKILNDICVPLPVMEYIVPKTLLPNS